VSNTPEELKMARGIKRGIAVLFIFVGVLALRSKTEPGSPVADFFAGIVAIGMGGALLFHLRWARWLALGACYLAIAAACALPAILFLTRSFEKFDGTDDTHLFTKTLLSAIGLVVGGVGYKGLKYYRSDLGRVEHVPVSMSPESVAPERSTQVLYSALVWVVLLGIGWGAGMSWPRWLFDGLPRGAAHRDAAPPPAAHRDAPPPPAVRPVPERKPRRWKPGPWPIVYFDVPRGVPFDPRALGDDATQGGTNLPDLVPLGLCVKAVWKNQDVVPAMAIAYTNNGSSPWESFSIEFSAGGVVSKTPRDRGVMVPVSNRLAYSELIFDRPIELSRAMSAGVRVTLDADNQIPERDESNNSIGVDVIYDDKRGMILPPCNNLRLRIK
jgi:hypothetical protein